MASSTINEPDKQLESVTESPTFVYLHKNAFRLYIYVTYQR